MRPQGWLRVRLLVGICSGRQENFVERQPGNPVYRIGRRKGRLERELGEPRVHGGGEGLYFFSAVALKGVTLEMEQLLSPRIRIDNLDLLGHTHCRFLAAEMEKPDQESKFGVPELGYMRTQ
jgi:hypothetical protein